MKSDDVKLLRCIECSADLSIKPDKLEGDTVVVGILECVACDRKYPVLDRVGVFFSRDVLGEYLSEKEISLMQEYGYDELIPVTQVMASQSQSRQAAVASNWEYQWEEVYRMDQKDYEKNGSSFGAESFWSFIPVAPEAYLNRTCLVACGGRGREAYHISKVGPSKIIVNEIGAEIYSIRDALPNISENLLLLRCDITNHPLKPGVVDIVICDHALQHVADHNLGFTKMTETLTDSGMAAICVYSYENNFLMTHIVEPAKKVIHLFSLPFQRIFSWLPAVIVYLLITLVYMPLNAVFPRFAGHLPLNEHLMVWSNNGFKLIWLSCFDLIHAPISYHFRKEELLGLARENKLEVEKIVNTNGTLWSLVCRK